MNKIYRPNLRRRLKAAIHAFRGKSVGHIYFGVDVKRCSECRCTKCGAMVKEG